MSLRADVAAIVERLEAIEQIFNQYIATISVTQDRDRDLKPRAEIIRAEVAFDEATKRAAKEEADRLYAIRNSIRVAAWAAFAAALLYAGVSWNQLREMRLQSEQIFHQSQAANASASYAALQSSQQQLNIAQQQINTAQQQTKAAQESAEAIQRNIMEEQRAWIAPRTAGFESEELGQAVAIRMTYTNTGKTPARDVRAVFVGAMLTRNEPANLQNVDGSSANASRFDQGILFPNEQLPLESILIRNKTGQNVIVSKELNDQYAAGKIWFLIHGTITYIDVFKVPHRVRYCDGVYHDGPGALGAAPPPAMKTCASYDSVDDN